MSIFSQALENPSQDNVDQSIILLYRMRWIAILGQIAISLIAHYVYGFVLPITWMIVVIAVECIFQAVTAFRIHNDHKFADIELFLHLLIDVLFLTGIVFLNGGTNNPFTYLLLIPVALGNFMLKPRQLILLTLIVCTIYFILHMYHVPLSIERGPDHRLFSLHLVGMLVNFEITAFILALFGLTARGVFLAQQSKIQLLREKQMKDEQVLSLGIMSANAAHDLSTPLSTIAIIADDLSHNDAVKKNVEDDIELMRTEIQRCKTIIDQLSQRSRDSRDQIISSADEDISHQDLHQQLTRLVETWTIIRPEIDMKLTLGGSLSSTDKGIDINVEQAISNLLNNAADASLENDQKKISFTASLDTQELEILIQDYGAGIPESLSKQLGKQITDSQKPTGLGWGHFLSNASIEHSGGTVTIKENEFGTITRIVITFAEEQ